MATNSRNGSKQQSNSHTDSGADKKKLTEKEFYGLEKLHLELKIFKLLAENEEKERKLKTLARRIMELEQTQIQTQYNQYVSQHKELQKKLIQTREEIAQRLNVTSLDEYFVDDQTFELTHQDKIVSQ